MHRIITARNLYQSSFHGLSLPVNNSVNSTTIQEIKCSYCRYILLGHINPEYFYSLRHQSTKTASLLKPIKKRKIKSSKQYGELLAVGDKAMTETKVSISKLRAVHLSKLASSSVSLEQLHQLTTKTKKKSVNIEVDPELLQTVREKILNKSKTKNQEVLLDDNCALIYTNQKLSGIEDKLKTKQYLDMVKDSYYNFRRSAVYDQRLQDLRYAINEGLIQQFDQDMMKSNTKDTSQGNSLPRSPHAVFRELFVDNNHLDSYDQELMDQISTMQSKGLVHPALDDILDDSALHNDLDIKDVDIDLVEPSYESSEVKGLKVNKIKAAMKKKKRAQKNRTLREQNMKHDMKELEQHGKQEALHKMLAAHLNLLSSLKMISESRQVLQYYIQRSNRMSDRPKVTDVKVYNILLHGYASMGQLGNTIELLDLMSQNGIEHDVQTYAAIFECIERTNHNDKLTLLNKYHQEMKEKGITLNDLVDKCKFLYDQRECLINAVRLIEPDFQPQYTSCKLDYSCPLLENIKLDAFNERLGLLQCPSEGLLTVEEMVQRGKEQLEIEIKGDIVVKNIDIKDDDTSANVKFCRQKLHETEEEWKVVIRDAIIRNLGTLKSQSTASHSPITLFPYLKVLEVDQYVDLIMGEITKLVDGSETYSPTLKQMQRELGTQVYHRYQIDQYRCNGVLDKINEIYTKYCKWYVNRDSIDGSGRAFNARQAWQTLAMKNRTGASLDVEETPWPMDIRQNVGKFLYNIIINDVKIDVNMFKTKNKQKKLPAVYKVHRPWGRLMRLELKPHPTLARLWAGAARPSLRMRAALAPTRAPPAPWARPAAGAYPLTPTPLIRMPMNVTTQWKRIDEAPPESLYPVLDSLNQLGEVPWVINQRILDLQLQVFRSGGNKKLDIPPPASSLDTSQFGAGTTASAVFKRRVAISRARAEMHSLWCDALYKLSLANYFRLQYAESIMDKILDSADKPLNGKGWWMKSEDPWQTLACCMEIANAIRSPNPEEYVSSFPVHQDGSCNGLQHYAALGGDAAGAAAVNLAPDRRPQDVYSAVAALVEEMRARDAAAGVAPAIVLENFVRRKVIKQTVMTTVYGVTKFGARLQIAKQLKDIDEFPKEHVWACSHYLTVKTFDSLREMFTSTKLIQDWFTDCAKLISGVCGESVEWVTPLGLPVVQPYYRRAPSQTAPLDMQRRPCTMKQRNAFPPNLIHSLDSSHMMLTGLKCQAQGVTFVSVHDCFWTHACSVDAMNKICREEFIALHSQPILEDLSQFMMKRYSYNESELDDRSMGGANKKRVNNILQKVPPKGNFDLKSVKDSVYFFS